MSARVIARGVWLSGLQATADGAITVQLPGWQRRIHRFPAELGRAFGAGMAKLDRNFGVGFGMDEIDDPLPRGFMLGRDKARCSRA